MCLYIGGLISQAGSSAFANGHCAAFGGVKSSVLIDGDHPESMTLAEQDSPPPSASQEAIIGGGRTRPVCDVHASTWGFRVMTCVHLSATLHKLRTSLSDPRQQPTTVRRRSP